MVQDTEIVEVMPMPFFVELWFRVWGLGFGVWGLGFGVWGSGLRVQGSGCRWAMLLFWQERGVWGLGFGVRGSGVGVSGLGFGVWGLGAWGLGFRVSGLGCSTFPGTRTAGCEGVFGPHWAAFVPPCISKLPCIPTVLHTVGYVYDPVPGGSRHPCAVC